MQTPDLSYWTTETAKCRNWLVRQTNYIWQHKMSGLPLLQTRRKKPWNHSSPNRAKISSSLSPRGGSRFFLRQSSSLPMSSSFLWWLLRKAWPLQSWLYGPDSLHKKEMGKETEQVTKLTTSSLVTCSLQTRKMTPFPKCI